MINYLKIVLGCMAVFFTTGCKDMYDLPDSAMNVRLLVVEGNLNSGSGSTTIKLSRTVNLKDTVQKKPELKATVTIEGENGVSYPLTGNMEGEYNSVQLPINANTKYRLRIKTTENKEYLSDYVPVLNAPPIDSVSWQRKESGLETGIQIYVNTHDPQNNTKYYRWDYDETWEFHSPIYSGFEYKNDSVLPRPDPTKVLICWKTELSNQVLVSSSQKLTEDRISFFPLITIPFGSIKFTVRYSILVRQYALTRQAYEYWDVLKKNTEQLGTLFDPQPSNFISNIHCVTNPNEQVVGFISAGSIAEKRLFISKNEVDPWSYFSPCIEDSVVKPKDYKLIFGKKFLIPTREEFNLIGVLVGYWGTEPMCADCTLRGTNVKPSFW
ncbi:MAG: DUF4249 domain-containing protein [Bacteroidia bacterium]|nr:DUF4249 domain-containing protein [Bacteroidia bacterium]